MNNWKQGIWKWFVFIETEFKICLMHIQCLHVHVGNIIMVSQTVCGEWAFASSELALIKVYLM